jgi:hypothetical protein
MMNTFKGSQETWLLTAVMALSLITHILPAPRTIDDAFITFRYSRNLVEGQGFVYNPGVQTLGTTTPLYTLLMAAISAITGRQDFPWYALTLNALADAGTAGLLFLLAKRLTGYAWVGALIGALWAISPASVTFAVGGMETSLNIFWLVGATYLFVARRRRIWIGAFVGLGFLTRVDSLLWIGPLLLGQLVDALHNEPLPTSWRGESQPGRGDASPLQVSAPSGKLGQFINRLPWQTWLAAVVVVLPWALFAWAYFGSPLPNSLSAKTVAYIMPPGSAFIRLLQFYVTPFSEFDLFGSLGAMIGTAIYLALTIIGLIYTRKKLPRLLPFLLYPWLYMAAFSIANPLIFRWYIAPPLPALMMGIIAGAWAIIDSIQQAHPNWLIRPVMVGALALLWGATSFSGWWLHPDHGPDRPAPKMAWHLIEVYYEQIGTQLRDEYGVTVDTRVASADIGAIGYFSRATIIDTVGLVTPELSKYYPIDSALIAEGQNYAIPPQLIEDTNPEFLVTMEAFVRLGLEKEPEFTQNYELVEEIPTDFYGTGMRLYERKFEQ